MRAAALASLALGTALVTAPSAGASLVTDYGKLAHAGLKPAPLVPVTAPVDLRPLPVTLRQAGLGPGGRYAVRVADRPEFPVRAQILLQRGTFKSVAAAVREARRFNQRVISTRVRGRAAKLFVTRFGGRVFTLVWSEQGQVYDLSTPTPRRISVRELRAVAAGLQPLEREYVATTCNDEGLCQGATAVTTPRTAGVYVEWGATCQDGTTYGGAAEFSLLPRSGDRFSFSLAPTAAQPWTVNGTGTVSPERVLLNVRASGSPQGTPCDTGALTLDLSGRFAD